MDVEITKANESSYRLGDHDVVVRDFAVSSIEMRPAYSGVDGGHGRLERGATCGSRTISIPFYINAFDMPDVALLRDKLFGLVSGGESFYIREMRRPKYARMHVCDDGESDEYADKYGGGKRYKVRLTSSPFDIEQMFTYGFGELVFETTDLPFSESIGTTMEVAPNEYVKRINAISEVYYSGVVELGAALDRERFERDEPIPFRNEGKFTINNKGNVIIDPFQSYLKIKIEVTYIKRGNLEVINNTTGDRFVYRGDVSSGDVIELNGPLITRNGLNSLRETNRKFINLETGINNFTIKLDGKCTISFDFNYLYL